MIVIANHFRSYHDHEMNVAHIFQTLTIMIVSDLGHTEAEWFGILKKNELAKPHINYESRAIM